jgi:hypothetical protein
MDPSESSTTSSDVMSLLFKAVKGLSDEEQRVVFEYFYSRSALLGSDISPLP